MIPTLLSRTWLPDSKLWEWSRLVPEWTTGRKVKGTETCGHTVMEPGTSLMTGSALSHRRDNSTDTRTLLDIQTGSAAIHMLIDESVPVKRGLLSQALQTRGGDLEARLTKALPNSALSLSIYISVFFLSLPHNKHTHTHTHTHNRWWARSCCCWECLPSVTQRMLAPRGACSHC